MVTFNGDGHLPPGIHLYTIEQIKQAFGSFQTTDQRPKLYKKLLELVEEAKGFDFMRYIVIDGSFVTDKSDPGDIDLIIVVDQDIMSRLETEILNPFAYNLLSSRRLKRRFSFDVFVAAENSDVLSNYINFFSRIKNGNSDGRKGIVRLDLK